MIRTLLLIICLSMPAFIHAQNKKSNRKLEAEVKRAKEEYEAAERAKSNQEKKLPATELGAEIIPLSLINSDGNLVTNNDLPAQQPIILVLFNPMCDHCQKLAMTLQENASLLGNTTIIFICGLNLMDELKNFIASGSLLVGPRFIVSAAQEATTAQLFKSKGIPQIMLYNKERKLQQIYYETLDIEKALTFLNN